MPEWTGIGETPTEETNMINLQPHKDGFRYRTGEAGEVIEVEVTYYKNMRRRGVYVSIRPITLSDGFISYVLTSGTNTLAMELARSTPKKVLLVAQTIDPVAAELAQLFATDKPGALALLQSAIDKLTLAAVGA